MTVLVRNLCGGIGPNSIIATSSLKTVRSYCVRQPGIAGIHMLCRICIFPHDAFRGLSARRHTGRPRTLGARNLNGPNVRCDQQVLRTMVLPSVVFTFRQRALVRIFTLIQPWSPPAHTDSESAYGYIAYPGNVMPQGVQTERGHVDAHEDQLLCFLLLEIPRPNVLALKLGANQSGRLLSILLPRPQPQSSALLSVRRANGNR